MMKQRIVDYTSFSVLRFLALLSLLAGFFLTSVFVTLTVMSIYAYEAGIVLAFSVLLIGAGFILYFFYLQFSKLRSIAEEIELNEDEDSEASDEPTGKDS
jgi:hypothetical protein